MLTLILALIRVTQAVVSYLAQRDLIDAGRALEANKALNKTMEELSRANEVRRKFASLSDAQRLQLSERYKRK